MSESQSEGTPLLDDPHHTAADIRMIGRAVREGWVVPAPKKPVIINRLMGIVEKQTVIVATATGAVSDEAKADSHAIRAAAVLVDMDGKDQTDFWNADKNARMDSGKPTELAGITVHVPGLVRPANITPSLPTQENANGEDEKHPETAPTSISG